MDRYERIKKIGEGSFGKALLVKRKNDGRHCVVKEIAIGRMAPKEREESKKEVKVLSQLKHPNIVMYQESFEGMGNLYIVMDYCEGGDLYQKITTQRGINFKETQVLDYFVQICLALKHIHDRKILHRDLKSQNIFLTRHGIVKLGDFGIARVLKSTVELARTCIGTPYYLSPEICENRPYNNKSDIWSLGCVLYELCTLKHAFEAGSMKNLVLKIIRGNYPPLPNRYTADLRSLVAQCFKRSPIERPSINRILKTPIIQERIKKFLSPEVMEDEFSHTILHKEKFGAQRQPIARPISADVRRQNPVAQVYGVSVAKRPVSAANNKKPNFVPPQQKRPANGARRPGAVEQNKAADDRRREMEGREKRRRNLVENQEREYQEYLKNIQKKRYEKQQADRMNRAREVGWKGLLKSDDDKNKKQQNAVNKQQNPMEKFAPKERVKDNVGERKEKPNKEDVPEQRPLSARDRPVPGRDRPVSARERPFEAYAAAKGARDNRAMGGEAAEKARLVEDYWQRKREAADNKARGSYDYQPSNRQQEPHAGLAAKQDDMHRPKADVAVPAVHGRNREEQAYLQQLEKIRRQNYLERKQLQNRNQFPNKPPLPTNNRPDERPGGAAFDPRYDPEARRQKIAALKAQADQRAALLREELNNRRKVFQQRLDNERDERERQRDIQQKQIQNRNERALPAQQNKPKGDKEKHAKPKIAAAAVGLETAMNQVAAARLFRSCSEGDLQEMMKKGEQMIHDRKHWNQAEDFGLAALPLEVTASAMEITSAIDAVFKPRTPEARPESAPHRRNWGAQGKTQVLSVLENKTLAVGTMMPTQTPASPETGSTVVLSKREESPKAKPIGETIILPKRSLQKIGETNTIASPEKSEEGKGGKVGGTIVLPKRDGQEKEKLPFVESKELSKASQEGPGLAKSPRGDDKGIDIEMKSGGTAVTDDNDDSDIEELTAVYEAALNDEEKPKARAAWGAHGKQPLVFKHEDPNDGNNSTKDKEDNESNSSSETSFGSPAKETEINMNSGGKTDVPLFEKTGKFEQEEGEKEEENLKAQDVSLENDSFHTPNASLLETRTKGLQTGFYDSSPKILRTVSMPGLQMKSEESNEYIANENDDTCESSPSKQHEDEDAEESKESQQNQRDADAVVIDDLEDDSNNMVDNDDDNDDKFAADGDDDDDDDRSDEEMEDFEHMLDSMRGVLSSADASPPTSAKVMNDDLSPLEIEDEDENRCSSSNSRKSNEEWEDSDDDDDQDDNAEEGDLATGTVKSSIKQATKTARRTKARETLFQRIEESRKALEDELGTEKFLKVYRYIQAMQENEDDDMNIDPTKDNEVSDMLEGTNEHLYQRILYLVLADAAYFEDNE